MRIKYQLTTNRKFKNNTEKQCYAFLTSEVQGIHELPPFFDDGQNKVPIIARNSLEQMAAAREKSKRGLVCKSHIKAVISADQSKADFYNNSDEEPFLTLSKI